MPTLPSESSPAPSSAHQARQMAESFGTDAQRYDSARPRYPQELVERIVAGRQGLAVIDVGCGTGIAARQFQDAGCAVLGVDPDERMAVLARERGLEVEVATFEAWEPAARRFDVVTAAQSWHWIDPVIGVRKAAEILRLGGRLAIFSHVFQPPDDIAIAFAEAFQRVVPDSPFNGQGQPALEMYEAGYARIADSIRGAECFEDVEQWRLGWAKPYSRAEWLELLPTTGGLIQLTADKKAEILDSVGAAIDARGGSFTMESVTLCATGLRVA